MEKEKRLLVYGVHKTRPVEFKWRVSKNRKKSCIKEKDIKVGDCLVVNTKIGKSTIKVTKLEWVDKEETDKYKCVIRYANKKYQF